MARKVKNGETAGCLFLLLFFGGLAYIGKASDWGWPVVIAGVVSIVLLAFVFREKTCGVCGGPIARASRKWTVNGKKVVACPTCSRRLQTKASKEAVDRMTS